MARKLDGITTMLAEQEKAEVPPKNAGNADKLGGLLGDIRDAIMEYQVCRSLNYVVSLRLTFKPDFNATSYLQQGS